MKTRGKTRQEPLSSPKYLPRVVHITPQSTFLRSQKFSFIFLDSVSLLVSLPLPSPPSSTCGVSASSQATSTTRAHAPPNRSTPIVLSSNSIPNLTFSLPFLHQITRQSKMSNSVVTSSGFIKPVSARTRNVLTRPIAQYRAPRRQNKRGKKKATAVPSVFFSPSVPPSALMPPPPPPSHVLLPAPIIRTVPAKGPIPTGPRLEALYAGKTAWHPPTPPRKSAQHGTAPTQTNNDPYRADIDTFLEKVLSKLKTNQAVRPRSTGGPGRIEKSQSRASPAHANDFQNESPSPFRKRAPALFIPSSSPSSSSDDVPLLDAPPGLTLAPRRSPIELPSIDVEMLGDELSDDMPDLMPVHTKKTRKSNHSTSTGEANVSTDSLPSYQSGTSDRLLETLIELTRESMAENARHHEEESRARRDAVSAADNGLKDLMSNARGMLATLEISEPQLSRIMDSFLRNSEQNTKTAQILAKTAKDIGDDTRIYQTLSERQDMHVARNGFITLCMQMESEVDRLFKPLFSGLVPATCETMGELTVLGIEPASLRGTALQLVADFSSTWATITQTPSHVYKSITAFTLARLGIPHLHSVLHTAAVVVDFVASVVEAGRKFFPEDTLHARILGAAWKGGMRVLEYHYSALVLHKGDLVHGEGELLVSCQRLRSAIMIITMRMRLPEYSVQDGRPMTIPEITPNSASPFPLITTQHRRWSLGADLPLPACIHAPTIHHGYIQTSYEWELVVKACHVAGIRTAPDIRGITAGVLDKRDEPLKGHFHSNINAPGPLTGARSLLFLLTWLRRICVEIYERVSNHFTTSNLAWASASIKAFGRLVATVSCSLAYIVRLIPEPFIMAVRLDLNNVVIHISERLSAANALLPIAYQHGIRGGATALFPEEIYFQLPRVISNDHEHTPVVSSATESDSGASSAPVQVVPTPVQGRAKKTGRAPVVKKRVTLNKPNPEKLPVVTFSKAPPATTSLTIQTSVTPATAISTGGTVQLPPISTIPVTTAPPSSMGPPPVPLPPVAPNPFAASVHNSVRRSVVYTRPHLPPAASDTPIQRQDTGSSVSTNGGPRWPYHRTLPLTQSHTGSSVSSDSSVPALVSMRTNLPFASSSSDSLASLPRPASTQVAIVIDDDMQHGVEGEPFITAINDRMED
ncbi:hypothetical protein DL93DRAFT_1115914 [Clavulina sp. PMI_390]|nr:hypothetical protein DL93DRAFT_1115914 [Clavulina sp. PMI_390]